MKMSVDNHGNKYHGTSGQLTSVISNFLNNNKKATVQTSEVGAGI
jgi:hypothetical protein